MNRINKENYSRLLILLLLVGCTNNNRFQTEDIVGVYYGINYSKSNDTLKLNIDGTYNRKIYSKNDKNVMIFENTDKWKLKESKIMLFNYLINNDELIIDNNFKYNNKDLTTALLEIRFKSKSIEIVENYDKNLFFSQLPLK